MGPTSAPHITLNKTTGGQAKELGSMIVKASQISDWVESDTVNIYTSIQHPYFTIYKVQVESKLILDHQQLQRHHGAEDPNDVEVEKALEFFPCSMWVSHQADVGLLKLKPVHFEIDMTVQVNLPQYPIKSEAISGISDNITGILKAGVI